MDNCVFRPGGFLPAAPEGMFAAGRKASGGAGSAEEADPEDAGPEEAAPEEAAASEGPPPRGPARHAAGLPGSSGLALEALALWAGARAGSPMAVAGVRTAIAEHQSAGELVDRLPELADGLRPKFAGEALDAAQAAPRLGGAARAGGLDGGLDALFERRTVLMDEYRALDHAEKVRAFSFTGAAGVGRVRYFQERLAAVLGDGGTFRGFKRMVTSRGRWPAASIWPGRGRWPASGEAPSTQPPRGWSCR
jgi:hypothetical protein